jgi:hypothetical protein
MLRKRKPCSVNGEFVKKAFTRGGHEPDLGNPIWDYPPRLSLPSYEFVSSIGIPIFPCKPSGKRMDKFRVCLSINRPVPSMLCRLNARPKSDCVGTLCFSVNISAGF